MAGKGGKGLLAAKTTAANKDKDKKKPISRSARAGLQVRSVHLFSTLRHPLLLSVYEGSFSDKVGCEWFDYVYMGLFDSSCCCQVILAHYASLASALPCY